MRLTHFTSDCSPVRHKSNPSCIRRHVSFARDIFESSNSRPSSNVPVHCKHCKSIVRGIVKNLRDLQGFCKEHSSGADGSVWVFPWAKLRPIRLPSCIRTGPRGVRGSPFPYRNRIRWCLGNRRRHSGYAGTDLIVE